MNSLLLYKRWGVDASQTSVVTLSELHPDPQSAYPSAMSGNTAQLHMSMSSTSINYASVPYDAALDVTDGITLEWRGVMRATSTAPQTLVEHPHTSHSAPFYMYALFVQNSMQTIRFDLTVDGTRHNLSSTVADGNVATDEPIHVAGTFDGSDMKLYYNGRLLNTNTVSGTIDTANTGLYFGRHGNVTFQGADASHDEVRLWNTARSKEDIVLNMDRQLVGSESGLVGLWLFNEGSGTTIADETSNNNTASTTGTITWESGTFTWDGSNDEKHHIPTNVNLSTSDGSGETIDPSVVYVPGGLNGYTWWMAVTPYPDGDRNKENPHIFASNNGIDWEVPSGVTNPIFGPTGDPDTNFSDTCLLIIENEGTKELWLYFRWFDHSTNDEEIRYSKSSDGVTWSASQTVLTATPASINNLASPAIWHDDSQFVMLAVNTEDETVERRTSNDGLSWSSSSVITVNNIGSRIVSHIDAERIGSTVHILLHTRTGVTSSDRVHYAASADNGETVNAQPFLTATTWSYEEPQYNGSLVLDPTTQDRWWVFYATRKRDSGTDIWHSRLMMRRLESGDMYQENALP